MPSNDVHLAMAFGDTRIQQVVRLVNLQRQHYKEFGERGRYIARHAIFTIAMDCRIAGIERTIIGQRAERRSPVGSRAGRALTALLTAAHRHRAPNAA